MFDLVDRVGVGLLPLLLERRLGKCPGRATVRRARKSAIGFSKAIGATIGAVKVGSVVPVVMMGWSS